MMFAVKVIYTKFVFTGMLLLYMSYAGAQKLTENQVKTGLIFSFAKYFYWEKESQIDTFKIGIYSDDNAYTDVIKTIGKQLIKGRPVKVIVFNSIGDIYYTHILIAGNDRNYFIKEIFEIIKGKNTLLVTDRCEYKRYVMANFIYNAQNQVQFEINSRNVEDVRLKTSPKLVLLGGSEIDVRRLYVETEKSLNIAREKSESYEKELLSRQLEISAMNKRLNQLYEDINVLQDRILVQKNELSGLNIQALNQQKVLDEKTSILDAYKNEILIRELQLTEKDKAISLRQKQVDEYSLILEKQKKAVEQGKRIISNQEKTLNNQTDRIKTQQNFLYLLGTLITMSLAMAFLIYNSYRVNRKKNRELQKMNEELSRSRNEIVHQASLLEIKNSELEKLSIVASKTDNAVIILDENGDMEWVNEGFERMYGYTLNQFKNLRGKNLPEVSSCKFIADILENIAKNKKSATYEAAVETSAGKKVWVHTTLTPILDENGNIRKIIVIDSDITSLKEAEMFILEKNEEIQRQSEELYEQAENLQALNCELEAKRSKLEETLDKLKSTQTQLVESEKMVILGQLTAGIAHEINNPINYISSGIEGIKMAIEQILELQKKFDDLEVSVFEEKMAEIDAFKQKIDYPGLVNDIHILAHDIQSGVNRTIEIIKGLRTFTRLDETDLKIIDLNKSIDSTLVILRNKYANRINVHRNYGSIPIVECFPGKINQVLLNVLVNAIQAIKKEGDIYISTGAVIRENEENVLISIKDTGMGMPEEVKRKIFEPFFTTKEAGEGTGLGLSITYSIIENHNGFISVESVQGAGTTFNIFLPVEYKKKELPLNY